MLFQMNRSVGHTARSPLQSASPSFLTGEIEEHTSIRTRKRQATLLVARAVSRIEKANTYAIGTQTELRACVD